MFLFSLMPLGLWNDPAYRRGLPLLCASFAAQGRVRMRGEGPGAVLAPPNLLLPFGSAPANRSRARAPGPGMVGLRARCQGCG